VFKQANAFVANAGEERAERTFQQRNDDARAALSRASRSLAERARERFTKPAVRFKTGAQGHVVQGGALADSRVGAGQAVAATPRGKTHPVVLFGPAPG